MKNFLINYYVFELEETDPFVPMCAINTQEQKFCYFIKYCFSCLQTLIQQSGKTSSRK